MGLEPSVILGRADHTLAPPGSSEQLRAIVPGSARYSSRSSNEQHPAAPPNLGAIRQTA
jgi:hypothetical protein